MDKTFNSLTFDRQVIILIFYMIFIVPSLRSIVDIAKTVDQLVISQTNLVWVRAFSTSLYFYFKIEFRLKMFQWFYISHFIIERKIGLLQI